MTPIHKDMQKLGHVLDIQLKIVFHDLKQQKIILDLRIVIIFMFLIYTPIRKNII